MNQTSSSSNMSKSTADTIKQIQKQGLSISIVSADSPRLTHTLDSSVSKEIKPKQIVSIDKTPKLPSRSLVSTESKATLSQVRSIPNTSAETRASGGQPLNQSVFQESKISGSNNRVVPISTATETRAFGSQSWSNPPSSESKVQTSSNRATQSGVVYTENKTSAGPTRVSQSQVTFSENKNQIIKGNQNMTESKSQGRVSMANCLPESKQTSSTARNHLTFEGKVPSSQNRNPLNSPPLEGMVINTRLIQNFPQDSKGAQRTIPQMVADGKLVNIQPKPAQTRLVGAKLPTQLQANQITKGTPQQTNKVIVLEHQNTPLSNLALNNPFRTPSTSLGEKSATSNEKSLVKTNRVSQNFVKTKNQYMNASNFQSMSMQSESKAVSQVVKICSGSSNNPQKTQVPLDAIPEGISPSINAMSSTRPIPKRPQTARAVSSSPAKRKCIKKSPNAADKDGVNAETNRLDAEKPRQFEMQGITRGLTITPINSTTTCASTSTGTKKTAESAPEKNSNTVVRCQKCSEHSHDINYCDHCQARIPANAQKYHLSKVRHEDLSTMVVEKKIYTTTSRVEKIFYQLPSDITQNQSLHFHQAVQGKVRIETSTPVSLNTRGKGRPKGRRKAEPICYTLSSDEEDPMPFHPMEGASFHASQIYPIESEGSKSDHSSASEMLHDENQESDDPQYPGVMDINPNLDGEEEPDEDVVFEREEIDEEEEDMEDEEPLAEEDELDEEDEHEEEMEGQLPTEYPLRCRSIRIGSYKVHPPMTSPYVAIILQLDSLTFKAPVVTDTSKYVVISLRNDDIRQLVFHFGRCLPIMFIYTTPKFGESVRNALHMVQNESPYFDPSSKDDKTEKLTFLIEHMTEDQKNFIRQVFPGEKKVKEIDQKTANEILVRSTPATNQPNVVKFKGNDLLETNPNVVKFKGNDHLDNPIPHISNQVSVTKIVIPPAQPPQPVVKLLTYPPPPQTGGIAVTNEDLACLNEGDFLNDVIIDFYLKYIFCEKLSLADREKTHIFSSFFYPRLTHKSERQRVGDDPTKTAQFKRHNQVKTWTRHVDIFSKDYIIIPVNMNVHWFLAIICYPNRVPDAPNVPEKATECVSSTDEQEHVNKVTIKEISSNGEDNSPNQDDSSMNSSLNSPYMVEEPPDSDEYSETPDSSTHPDGKQRKEMPCICIFDSLCGPNRWRIATTLREYLEMEWKSKKGTRKVFDRNTMQGFIMKCPQQTNFSDCGLYLLQFVESFFENPIPFATPMPDLTNWFTEVKINKKRQELKDLILSLQKKQANAGRKIQHQDRNQSSSTNIQQMDNR